MDRRGGDLTSAVAPPIDAAAEGSSASVESNRVGNTSGHVHGIYASDDINGRADYTDSITGGITNSVIDVIPDGIADVFTDGIPNSSTDIITDSITDGSDNVSAKVTAETRKRTPDDKLPEYLSASSRSCGAATRWRELSKAHEEFHRLESEGELSAGGRGWIIQCTDCWACCWALLSSLQQNVNGLQTQMKRGRRGNGQGLTRHIILSWLGHLP